MTTNMPLSVQLEEYKNSITGNNAIIKNDDNTFSWILWPEWKYGNVGALKSYLWGKEAVAIFKSHMDNYELQAKNQHLKLMNVISWDVSYEDNNKLIINLIDELIQQSYDYWRAYWLGLLLVWYEFGWQSDGTYRYVWYYNYNQNSWQILTYQIMNHNIYTSSDDDFGNVVGFSFKDF